MNTPSKWATEEAERIIAVSESANAGWHTDAQQLALAIDAAYRRGLVDAAEMVKNAVATLGLTDQPRYEGDTGPTEKRTAEGIAVAILALAPTPALDPEVDRDPTR